jgi:hypothetical protein
MGYCGNYDRLGFANPPAVVRGSFGFGSRGAGRGWRHRFYATGIPSWAAPTAEQETAYLKAQAEFLQLQLDAIQNALRSLHQNNLNKKVTRGASNFVMSA